MDGRKPQPSMAQMYSESGLAAVTFWGGSIRVYYQDDEGFIVEAGLDSGKWRAGGRIGAQARLGTPLAAVTWGAATDTRVQPQIRVFFQDQQHRLSEFTYGTPSNSPGWKQGRLQSLGLQSNTNSLAACMVVDSVIRVYYIPSLNSGLNPIVELAGDGSNWNKTSANIPTARMFRQGTSLSSIAWKDNSGAHVRIYYASEFVVTLETSYDDGPGWTNATSANQVGDNATCRQIAAITWGTNTDREIRTYTMRPLPGPNEDEVVGEHAYSSGTWSAGAVTSPMKPGGAIAAVTWSDATQGQQLHVFMNGTKTPIGEAYWVGGASGWVYKGAVPTTT